MSRILLSILTLFLLVSILPAQDQPVLATLEQGYGARVIGVAGSSLVFHDGGKIYISDGTAIGTKVIGALEEDEKIKHAKALLFDKLYFVIGKIVGASDDVEVLVEVDPASATMRNLVTSQDEITGLVNYRQRLYFALQDHPTFGHAYVSYKPETDEYKHMFDLEGYGVQDAVRHDGLIYLIMQSPKWEGISLAYSNGGPGIVEEIFNLRDSEAYGWDVTINMTSAENNLYFWYRGDSGFTLYVTDGTENGTLALKENIRSNHYENFETHRLRDIEVIGDRIFFQVDEAGFQPYLWTSDGTIAGTHELFLNGVSIFTPHGFTIHEGQLYAGELGDPAVVVDVETLTVKSAFEANEPGNEVLDAGHDMVNHNGTLYLSAIIKDPQEVEIFAKNTQSNLIDRVTDLDLGFGYIIANLTSAGENLFFFVMEFDKPSQLRIYKPNTSSTIEISTEQLDIYPNPSHSKIYLDNSLEYEEIIIIDSAGTVVKKIKQADENDISISELPDGLYFIQASTAKTSYSGKFFKS